MAQTRHDCGAHPLVLAKVSVYCTRYDEMEVVLHPTQQTKARQQKWTQSDRAQDGRSDGIADDGGVLSADDFECGAGDTDDAEDDEEIPAHCVGPALTNVDIDGGKEEGAVGSKFRDGDGLSIRNHNA